MGMGVGSLRWPGVVEVVVESRESASKVSLIIRTLASNSDDESRLAIGFTPDRTARSVAAAEEPREP